MDVGRDAAPEIDRLVWAVTTNQGTRDQEVAALLRDTGIESVLTPAHFADWLLATGIEPDLALRRAPYLPAGTVEARLEEMARKGLTKPGPDGAVATQTLRPALEAMQANRAAVAAGLWCGHETTMETIEAAALAVAAATPAEFAVAASHRALPVSADRYLRLHQRLMTMRYIRSHAHVTAWTAAGLTAPEMVTFTQLWHGGGVENLEALAGRGYALDEALTAEGLAVREHIEEETDRLVRPIFATLEDGPGFIEALSNLPGSPTG